MKFLIVILFCILTLSQYAQSQNLNLNLNKAHIYASSQIPKVQKAKYVQVLQEEIQERTQINWDTVSRNTADPLIILALANETIVSTYSLPSPQNKDFNLKPEGFRIQITHEKNRKVIWLIGNDTRGVLFAIGSFLSNIKWSKQKVEISPDFVLQTSPAYPLRGHQLGYRNTANSWDAWTVKQMEKYIRELALMGTNAIENIPLDTDGPVNPHFKISSEEMNLKMSEICRDYGIEYWVWTPGKVDLSNPAFFQKEVDRHAVLYKQCPKLDGVFFPGGDPGNNHPKYVMPFLKAIAAELKKDHPDAGVWVSLQGFSDEEVNYFYEYLEKNNPDWLKGVVSGPGSPAISSTRFRLPKKYQHRHYPDITHNIRSQYPVPNLDRAFALTSGREATNPRPVFYGKIHNQFAPFTDGFLTYSDGAHDDVNKIIWNQLGWDPNKPVYQILMEYARFHFGDYIAKEVVDGILALEQNWSGPIEENGAIETSYYYWKNLAHKAPQLSKNWRWQLLLLRADYDVYIKRRKIFEQGLEQEANAILNNAQNLGADRAMEMALEKVNDTVSAPIEKALSQQIELECEQLFQSMQLQTSVKKYQASGAERGAILDFLQYPLNNRWWLQDEFQKIKKLENEDAKLARLKVLSTWENLGDGSFYDDISNVSKSPRVKSRSEDATDFLWENNGMSRKRLSSQTYQNFPELDYQDLDPKGKYFFRIAGYGDALLRVDGERIAPTLYNKGVEEFKEFPLNPKFYSDGKIHVTFDQPEESHLNWRQISRVSDIWLIKVID